MTCFADRFYIWRMVRYAILFVGSYRMIDRIPALTSLVGINSPGLDLVRIAVSQAFYSFWKTEGHLVAPSSY